MKPVPLQLRHGRKDPKSDVLHDPCGMIDRLLGCSLNRKGEDREEDDPVLGGDKLLRKWDGSEPDIAGSEYFPPSDSSSYPNDRDAAVAAATSSIS